MDMHRMRQMRRETGVGRDCTGAPAQFSCRYWRMQQAALSRYTRGLTILRGRNVGRPFPGEAPA
eukprot:16451316-Heterocapsa_arctica.AAC.1